MAKRSSLDTNDKEPNLKGTFAFVMILGGILIGSWLAIFVLFLSRT